MRYINFVSEGDESTLHSAPVDSSDAEYLGRVIATLRPISDEDYMNGPAYILHTMARYSYVLDGEVLYWCVEWGPGFLVVRLTTDGKMAWTAIRSPVPNFGGREATDEDLDAYDEDADNPQYNLVFIPWDAQFDAQEREWHSFEPATDPEQTRFEQALDHVNGLGDVMEQRYANQFDEWRERCMKNIETWSGKGIRLAPGQG